MAYLVVLALLVALCWMAWDAWERRTRIDREVAKFAAWLETVEPYQFDKDATR